MYQVTVGSDVRDYPTRADAIAAAKELSSESRQAIFVTDESQRERMAYQYGELESYTYETRHNRRPRREREDKPRTEDGETTFPGENEAAAAATAEPAAEPAAAE